MRGIVPEQSVEKLKRCAEIALEEFDGELRPILKRPLCSGQESAQAISRNWRSGCGEDSTLWSRLSDPGAGIKRLASPCPPWFRNGDAELFRYLSLGSGSGRRRHRQGLLVAHQGSSIAPTSRTGALQAISPALPRVSAFWRMPVARGESGKLIANSLKTRGFPDDGRKVGGQQRQCGALYVGTRT